MKAIEIINKVGASRGYNGLPELLPGINFILGLPGERRESYRLNREFLEEILRRKLLVRRVNVRKILALPTTRVYIDAVRVEGVHSARAVEGSVIQPEPG